MTIGLDCEHQTRAHWLAVEQHRAGSAYSVLTSDMGASQVQVVTEEIAQQEPGLN